MTTVEGLDVAVVLDTAATALARAHGGSWTLSDPVDLGGSHRSVVARVRVAGPEGAPSSLVVKARPAGAERDGYAAEAAALGVVAGAPRLLAADDDAMLLVLEDLGSPPTLADALLGDDPALAQRRMLEWAQALAEVAVRGRGREQEYAESWARRAGAEAARRDQVWLPEAFTAFGDLLDAAGLLPDDRHRALKRERDDVLALLVPGPDRALGVSDACPDNVLFLPSGPRFLDFEAAAYRSVFLDAVYTRVPFATCWCVFDAPSSIVEGMESAYRSTLALAFPEATADEAWEAGMLRADAAFAVSMTAWLLESAIESGRPVGPAGRESVSRRALLADRWRRFAADPRASGRYPELAATFADLVATYASDWDDAGPLPSYPAFRAL